eukprot:jgi/Psemu1/37768/gm1.37768_g
MIDYSRETFTRSKHDPITLHRVDKDWKKYWKTIDKSIEFTHYKKFWGQQLKELYSSYHSNTTTANLADIQNDQRFTELENKQRDLANVCQEIYSQVTETATAASTMTMSNQWKIAMAVLQADVSRLKTADASGSGSPYRESANFNNQMGGATRNTDQWLKWNGPNPNGNGRTMIVDTPQRS